MLSTECSKIASKLPPIQMERVQIQKQQKKQQNNKKQVPLNPYVCMQSPNLDYFQCILFVSHLGALNNCQGMPSGPFELNYSESKSFRAHSRHLLSPYSIPRSFRFRMADGPDNNRNSEIEMKPPKCGWLQDAGQLDAVLSGI